MSNAPQNIITSSDLRYTDNSNGTVTDNLTNLVWLKNANTFGLQTWEDALRLANSLESGAWGLTNGSIKGEWRMPSLSELESLFDRSQFHPALTAGHLFENVQIDDDRYWSTNHFVDDTEYAWVAELEYGISCIKLKTCPCCLLPVKARL